MSEPRGNFLDRKTIIAIALTMVVWIGWQNYLGKKYPKPPQGTVTETSPPTSATDGTKVVDMKAAPPADAVTPTTIEEKFVMVDTESWSFKISSQGMGLRDIELKHFTDRAKQPIRLGAELGGRLPLETNLIGRNQPLEFAIEKVSETHYLGRAQANGLTVTKALILDPVHYRIDTKVDVTGASTQFMGLTTYLIDPLLEGGGGSFLAPQVERQDIFIQSAETSERLYLKHEDTQSLDLSRVEVVALGTHYFHPSVG
jgi:YidC/Oxa1 family membrane protein insertase